MKSKWDSTKQNNKFTSTIWLTHFFHRNVSQVRPSCFILQSMGRSTIAPKLSTGFRLAASLSSKSRALLPKFEVPPLRNAITQFIKFARPLQNDYDFHETLAIANKFLDGGEGEKLQALLEDRAVKLDNWLTPWWLNVAYLEARSPLPVVTSPGVMFPKWNYYGIEGQVDAAAKIIQAALRFYLKILKGELPQEKAGGSLFDMSQYEFLFGTTRVPGVGKDKIQYGKDIRPQPTHIVVIHNGHLFRVPVFDSFGNMLSIRQLTEQLRQHVLPKSQNPNGDPIGVVSSDTRDTWARIYARLKESSTESIRSVEESLFVICLDRKMKKMEEISEKDLQALQSLHGGGCDNNSANRWFDKTLQFIIGFDGYCSMTYEHTPAEGPPVATLIDFICDQFEKNNFVERDATGVVPSSSPLQFHISDIEKIAIANAKEKIDATAADTDLRVYTFDRFGKNFAKMCGISPDSFIQIAFQLAYYRIHRKQPPTYETGTLRKFIDGRTDTIRLPSFQSSMFTFEMTDAEDKPSISKLAHMLHIAAQEHKNYSVKAMNGRAMDRHLLGLRLIAQEHGLPVPKLFECDAYKKMMHFTLSTSQVPTRHYLQMCFGPSAPDCYGICYNPQERELHFTVCTLKSCPETDSARFVKEIGDALSDMRMVLEKSHQFYSSKL